MEIVYDGQTCNCAQDVIANFAENAFTKNIALDAFNCINKLERKPLFS
jgi:hypothetical protein